MLLGEGWQDVQETRAAYAALVVKVDNVHCSSQHSIHLDMHPPPSGRHAMRSLYGIGRESWVREMSRVTGWLVWIPPTKWGSIPSSAVCQLAGVYSGRPLSRVIVVVVVYLDMHPPP